MKNISWISAGLLAFTPFAFAAPMGICLHAYSPEAPTEKIECFEFIRSEKISTGYRFFLKSTESTVISAYRYRGVIVYESELAPGNPKFSTTLALYEKTARSTPSTRQFLNPRILAMRALEAAQKTEYENTAKLPRIKIGEKEFIAPKFKSIDDGKLALLHKDGSVRLDIDKITDEELRALAVIDPAVAKIKVIEISKNRLWNPRYEGLSKGNINIAHEQGILSMDVDSISESDCKKIAQLDPKFAAIKIVTLAGQKLWNPSFDSITSADVKIKHEKGILSLMFDSIPEKDKDIIMSWSDGTWKIGKPGFYNPSSDNNSYGEIILNNGRFHNDVTLISREGESIILKTNQAELKLPINEIGSIPGLSSEDAARIEKWSKEIIEDRFKQAKPEVSTKVLSFDEAKELRVTNVRVLILQVLDEGVLASKFVGTLHKGIQTVETTKTITAQHPVTGVKVSKDVDTS